MRAEPRIVGRYAIYEEIASGGMASVHIARLTEPSGAVRTVAIKRTHPHLARDPDFALMFMDEARVASRIRHPNVVATIEVLGESDELALVMDYVHGESVWKLAKAARERGERIPLRVAASILVDTLRGLHAAHEATDEHGAPLRIVHRDVSPQNILVGTDGIARLVDFGIAKAVGRLHSTRDSSVKGKYAYMAPEQIRGDQVSRLTDTYAAAIVFWEMLTGERLFAGKNEAETIHKCLVGRVQPPSLSAPEVGPELDEVLRKALSREPALRYQTALELAVDIESTVPAIDASEVGAWVERMAGESLAARAQAVAEIERADASDPSSDRSSDRKGSAEAARSTPPAPTETRVPGSRRPAMLLAAVAVVLVGVGGAALAARHKAPGASELPATTDSAAPAMGASPPPPPTSAPDPAPATPSAAPSPSAPQAATPPASAPAAARPAPRTPARPSHPKRASCDPPYSIDSAGRQIFKPECM